MTIKVELKFTLISNVMILRAIIGVNPIRPRAEKGINEKHVKIILFY